MRNKWIVLLGILLVAVAAAAAFFIIQNNAKTENSLLYKLITDKMKKGGKLHTLLPDIEHLLKRPFLQTDICNYTNILGAYINLRKNDYNEANHFFSNVKFEGKVYDVQDYVHYWWGQALWKQYKKTDNNRYLTKAKVCFKQVVDNQRSPMRKIALVDYIKVQYYSNDFSFLDSLPSDFTNETAKIQKSALPELLYILADSNKKKGNRQTSLDYLVQLWKQYPYSKWGSKAEVLLDEMGESALIEYPALSAGELLNTYDLIYQKNKKKSNLKKIAHRLDVLEGKTSGILKDRLQLLYGKVYYSMGRKYRSRSGSFLSRSFGSKDIETKMESAYFLMRHARNRNRFSKLKSIVRSIDSPKYRVSKYFDKTVYSAGFIFMRRKRYQDAVPIYRIVLKKGSEDNEYYDHALWRLHWCYYHLSRYDQALNILETMRKDKKWEEYSVYWTAYIYHKLGQKPEAESLYRYLLKDSGFTYYGMLAWGTLKRDFGVNLDFEKDKKEFVPLKVGMIEDESRNTRYKTLKENGLYEFAAAELEAYLDEQGISKEINEEYWRPYGVELAKLYFYTGKYIKAGLRLYWAYKEEVLKGARNIPPWFWEIYYPLFYKDTIDKYANRYGVNRNFLYAFIRQESFYEPYVVSYAGAIGVMQIMPGTGKQIAKDIASDIGLRSYSTELLYNPEVNIPMGIFHLKKHLYEKIESYVHKRKITKAYGKDMIQALMIAGYNAGIGRSYRWLRETRFDNQQELIDQIDIPETRRYVKLVLKHLFLYSIVKKQ